MTTALTPAVTIVQNYTSSGTQRIVQRVTPEVGPLKSIAQKLEALVEDSVSPGTLVITSAHYGRLLDSIRTLKSDEDEEDHPTDFAMNFAAKVLLNAARDLTIQFPPAHATVGPNGSLRITWNASGREVRLVFGGSPQNRSYIYWEHGEVHAIDETVNGELLASRLRWMAAD